MHQPAWKSLLLTAGLAVQFAACGGPSPAATEPLEQTKSIALTANAVKTVGPSLVTRQTDVTAFVAAGPSALALAPTVQNDRAYDYSSGAAESVIQTSDNGYVFTGSTTLFGDEDVLLVKTDSALNVQWAYAYGTTSSDSGVEVRATSDGGFIIAGTTFINNNYDFYLIKTDSAGTPQWATPYGGANQEYAAAMETTPDGGFIVVGRTQNNVGYQDAYMVKFSSTGSAQWSRNFSSGADGTYEFDGVANVPGGGYVAVGSKQVKVTNGWETYGFAAKVSSTGTALFQATAGRFATFYGVAATSTGYVAVGYIWSSTLGADFFSARFGPTGSTLWTRQTSGGTTGDYLTDVKVAVDGNYVISGVVVPGQDQRSLRIMKVDNNGNTLWTGSPYPSTLQTDAQCLAVTGDGGFITGGTYISGGTTYALLSKFPL